MNSQTIKELNNSSTFDVKTVLKSNVQPLYCRQNAKSDTLLNTEKSERHLCLMFQHLSFRTVPTKSKLGLTALIYFGISLSVVSQGKCISKSWVCDGDDDCEDRSDEDSCETSVCKPPTQPCGNDSSTCLPPHKICDGRYDCADQTDEGLFCGEYVHSVMRKLIRALSTGWLRNYKKLKAAWNGF